MKAISGTLVIAGLALILIALVIFMGPRFGRPFAAYEPSWTIATVPYSTAVFADARKWCGTYLNSNTNLVITATKEQADMFSQYGAYANMHIQAVNYPQVAWDFPPDMFVASSGGNPIIVARTGIYFDRSAEDYCQFTWDITFNQPPPTTCPTQDTGNCVYGSEIDSGGCFIKCQEPPLGTTPPPTEPPPPKEQPMPPDNSGIIAVIIILIFVLGIVYLKVR